MHDLRAGTAVSLLCSGVLAGLVVSPAALDAQHAQRDHATPGERWMQYAEPEEAGWSSDRIGEVKAFADSVGSSVGMLVHDGLVVASWGDVTYPATVFSLRKSLQVLVAGIHVERGDLDLDATLGELDVGFEPPLKPCE